MKAINMENKSNKVSCPRCGGSGELRHYEHIQAGKCFECGGRGVVSNTDAVIITEKIRSRNQKRAKKNKEIAKKQMEDTQSLWDARMEFAIDFNTKLIEKVIMPSINTDSLLKRSDFDTDVYFAERKGITTGDKFVDFLRDFDKRFLESHFDFQLEKYLREKYNYYGYLKNKLNLSDFFISIDADKINVSDDVAKKINALKAKYRDAFDEITGDQKR